MTDPNAFIDQVLEKLCIRIGDRPLGSRNNHRAQEFIGNSFRQHGCEVEDQDFTCMDWRGESVLLHANGHNIPASISPYSLPCNITAESVTLANIHDLETRDIRGRIAVLHGELTREAIMPKNFRFWNPEEHQKIIRLLEENKPAAIVAVSFNEEQPTPIFEDGDFDIPNAVVAKNHAGELLTAGSNIALTIVSERRPSRGANVIARKPGRVGKNKVVLTAHMDTKPGTPGALDNASGIASLLTLSLILQSQAFGFGLEFVAFNGEDHYSNAGEIHYLDKYQAEFRNILLNINCDGVGLKDSRIGISCMECPEPIHSVCDETRKAFNLIEWIEPWVQGDHMLFVMNRVPALTLTSSGIFPLVDTIIHTKNDTPALLDPESILQSSRFLERLMINLDRAAGS